MKLLTHCAALRLFYHVCDAGVCVCVCLDSTNCYSFTVADAAVGAAVVAELVTGFCCC